MKKVIDNTIVTAVAAAVHSRIPPTEKIAFSYLSGSVTEGLATPKSDYDAYVVMREPVEETEIQVATEIGMVEITLLSLQTFIAISSKLSMGYSNREGVLTLYELHLAHRLVTGVALHNQAEFSKLQTKINSRELSSYLAQFSAAFAEKCYSDAFGNLLANDEDSAIFNADRTVHLALDLLLAHKGNTSSLVKWRSRYAKAILSEAHPVFIRYMDLISAMPSHNRRRKREYIAHVGRFWQSVLDYVHAQKYFPNAHVEFTEARVYGRDELVEHRPGVLKKAPWARVIDKDHKLYIVGHTPLFEISRDFLLIWLLIDNESTEGDISLRLEESIWDQSRPKNLSANISQLKERGLIL